MKNILLWFIEGSNYFFSCQDAKMSLTLNELKFVAFHSNSILPWSMQIVGIECKTTSGESKETNCRRKSC